MVTTRCPPAVCISLTRAGPWVLLTPLPETIDTKPFTLQFKCTWHEADLCPDSYIVILRGPTIHTPPASAMTPDPNDKTLVNVVIHVQDPGNYKMYAWPDFNECRKLWKEMTYPINKGQIQGSPFNITISGPAAADSDVPCPLEEYTSPSQGRWIARSALAPKYASGDWLQNVPETQDYIFQPYTCKRPSRPISDIGKLESVKHLLFLGDSVMRGSFCTQIYPALSPSQKSDGSCTFVNDVMAYHVAPKNLLIGPKAYTFRFMDDSPIKRLEETPSTITTPPTHIVANLGLWLAGMSREEYTEKVDLFLGKMHQQWPEAVVIWRTTTDVAPMINCFTDKGMTRTAISGQRDASLELVKKFRGQGMKIYTVDAWKITAGRPDTGNDGRHWVIESPEEMGWLPTSRPEAGRAERAVNDAIVEVLVRADEMAAHKDGDVEA